MALKDRANEPKPTNDNSGFTCPHYSPKSGSKRCEHYLQNGACNRGDEFMCVEWLKANEQKTNQPEETQLKPASTDHKNDVDRDLFGNPLPPKPKAEIKAQPPKATLAPTEPRPMEAPLVRNLTDEEIASFKALGVEVCINTDEAGEIWLVPEYTGKDRKEITVEHAATLSMVCAAFPGAKVSSFEKLKPDSSEKTD